MIHQFEGYSLILNKGTEVCSQDRIWEGAEPPEVDLLDPKSGLFEPHPLNPPTKTPFLVHFVAKSGPFARFGGVECASHPSQPPGLHSQNNQNLNCLNLIIAQY